MDDRNSLVVYTTLYRRLLDDIAHCYVNSEPEQDWVQIQSRMATEGVSFLTKTLPSLGKSLDRALASVCPVCNLAFEFLKKDSNGLPILFGWLWKEAIGQALAGPLTKEATTVSTCACARGMAVHAGVNPVAVRHLRQLLYFAYKLKLPYDKKTENSVLASFVAVEEEIKTLQIDCKDAVIRQARKFITRVLGGSDPRDILPRHGPGAVSTGERGGGKTHFSRIYAGLNEYYSFWEYFVTSPSHICDRYDSYKKDLKELSHGTAKVVLVAKDSRGPRLISCEPLEYQWIQQGQQRKLYDLLERHRLTSGQVNFLDQRINRDLALESSKDGSWATLDMKDASDRVSVALVEALFSGTEWYPALMASRSAETRLPDGTLVRLSKFAPMGSAVCFPVEALCFYALCVAVLTVHLQVPFHVARKEIYVYGDDIICRRQHASAIMQHLPRFGLKFNEGKCCVEGFFRESCGCDAYGGVDVTPIRLRTTWSSNSKWSAEQLVSYAELSNALYAAGYRRSSDYVQELVESLYGPLPYLNTMLTSSWRNGVLSLLDTYTHGRVIGWYRADVSPLAHNLSRKLRMRFNASGGPKDLITHQDEVYGYIVKPVHKHYWQDGWEALLRTLTCGTTGLRFGTYALARRSRLERGWGTLFTGNFLRRVKSRP